MTARAGASSTTQPTRVEPERLLGQPAFRAFWLSRLLSQTAQGALLYGLFILIVDRTHQSIYSSLFVLCSTVPSLCFGLFGGWVADRMPTRPYMVALNVVRAALVLLLLRTAADLPTFFFVTLGIWTAHQFFAPAESAAVSRLVPSERLAAGASLSNLAVTLAQIIGMVLLAPLLLKLPDPRFLFGVCAALYGLGAVFDIGLGRLRTRDERLKRRQPLALKRGWRVVLSDRPSFAALLNDVLIGVGMSALVVIVPYYLTNVLHTGAGNTVFVFAPAVLGVVLGLQVAPWIGGKIGHGRLATIGLVGFSGAIAGFGLIDHVVNALQHTPLPLHTLHAQLGISAIITTTMLLAAPAGFFASLTNIGARTVLLDRSPAGVRGQVLATQGVLANAGAVLPTLGAGLAIDRVGARPVALAIAVTLLTVALLARWWSSARVAEAPLTAHASVHPADAGMLRFLQMALKAKDLRRQGWIDRGVHDPESDADHSWGVALLAWVLSRDRPELERERLLLLALVHDLPEVVAGDTTPFDAVRRPGGALPPEVFAQAPEYSAEARSAKREREAAALEQVLTGLSAEQASELRDAWREYDDGLTEEARFVRQIDKLETLIQAEAYRSDQPSLIVDSFWLGAQRDVKDYRLRRLFKAIGRTPGA